MLSVLALLAFACSPALAKAEATVYEVEDPNLPGETKTPAKHKNPDRSESSPKAHASGNGDGGSEQPDESSESQGGSSGTPGSPGGGGGTQGKDGAGAKVANKQPGGSVQEAQPLATTTAPSADDSSSPLVPILIAVAVLAAISVGVVLYRQRRGGDGRFSPNAS